MPKGRQKTCFQSGWQAGIKKQPVTDPPGREPESSWPGTRTKTFMFLGFRTQHINFWTPGHRSGDPPRPVGRPPPPGQSPEKFVYVYVYVPFPFLIHAARIKSYDCNQLWRFTSSQGIPRSAVAVTFTTSGRDQHCSCHPDFIAHILVQAVMLTSRRPSYRIEKPRNPENRRKIDKILFFAYFSRIFSYFGRIFLLFSGFLGFSIL